MSTNPLATGLRFSLVDASPFSAATYAFCGVCAAFSWLLLPEWPLLALALAALLCGWSETDGLCGTSHVSSLTPLRRMGSPPLWLKAATAYTVAGIVTSALTGALLGVLGAMVGIQALNAYAAIVFASGVLVLVVRELGWLHFGLPQVRLQTNKMWATEFGFVPAAGMWGAHIGIGFATVIKHGGYFMLVPVTMLLGPVKGSSLMATYWLGRALAMWMAPVLVAPALHGAGSALGPMVVRASTSFRWAAITGLVIGTTASAFLFLRL